MLEPTENPWQMQEEEVPPAFRFSVPEDRATTFRPSLRWLLIPLCLIGMGIWLVIQAFVLDLNYTVSFKPESLPLKTAQSFEILPAPVQYSLMQAADKPANDKNADKLSLSKNMVTDSHIIPVNYSAPILPDMTHLSKPPAEESTFRLIGIAQGSDGTVATLRIQDDMTGIHDQAQDVREGSQILGHYFIARITQDFVLIQDKKTGKSIRVE